MARTAFDPTKHLQLFRGSKLPPEVHTQHAFAGCCPVTGMMVYDRLGDVVHGPNSHTHLKPTSYNDKFMVPFGPVGGSLENEKNNIVNFINAVQVGAQIGVLCIPNYAFVTDVAVKIEASEPGLTFNLKTRNGLKLPSAKVVTVTTSEDPNSPCNKVRTMTESGGGNATVEGTADLNTGAVTGTATADVGNVAAFNGFGALGQDVQSIAIFGRDGQGQFAMEADEIILEVASMPTNKRITGAFRIIVSVNYTICDRAER